jgi:hypothetical protein
MGGGGDGERFPGCEPLSVWTMCICAISCRDPYCIPCFARLHVGPGTRGHTMDFLCYYTTECHEFRVADDALREQQVGSLALGFPFVAWLACCTQ